MKWPSQTQQAGRATGRGLAGRHPPALVTRPSSLAGCNTNTGSPVLASSWLRQVPSDRHDKQRRRTIYRENDMHRHTPPMWHRWSPLRASQGQGNEIQRTSRNKLPFRLGHSQTRAQWQGRRTRRRRGLHEQRVQPTDDITTVHPTPSSARPRHNQSQSPVASRSGARR